MATDDELKVKQLLEPSSEVPEEALARWFSLPSFQQLAEQPPAPPPVVDEEMAAVREQRARALAAIDPALVASIRERTEERSATLIKFEAKIDVHVDEQFGAVDEGMVARAHSIAEPREVEISDQMRDDLNECTPQALLRDLHRAVFDFDKQFELVDVSAEQRLDIVAEVKSAMATRWTLPDLGPSPFRQSRAVVEELRAHLRRPWTEGLATLPNRSVRE